MYPACAIDEYASIRTMLVCRSAIKLPTVIVSAASAQNSGAHTSWRLRNPTYTSSRMATMPPVFDATDRKAVTGVGAPS